MARIIFNSTIQQYFLEKEPVWALFKDYMWLPGLIQKTSPQKINQGYYDVIIYCSKTKFRTNLKANTQILKFIPNYQNCLKQLILKQTGQQSLSVLDTLERTFPKFKCFFEQIKQKVIKDILVQKQMNKPSRSQIKFISISQEQLKENNNLNNFMENYWLNNQRHKRQNSQTNSQQLIIGNLQQEIQQQQTIEKIKKQFKNVDENFNKKIIKCYKNIKKQKKLSYQKIHYYKPKKIKTFIITPVENIKIQNYQPQYLIYENIKMQFERLRHSNDNIFENKIDQLERQIKFLGKNKTSGLIRQAQDTKLYNMIKQAASIQAESTNLQVRDPRRKQRTKIPQKSLSQVEKWISNIEKASQNLLSKPHVYRLQYISYAMLEYLYQHEFDRHFANFFQEYQIRQTIEDFDENYRSEEVLTMIKLCIQMNNLAKPTDHQYYLYGMKLLERRKRINLKQIQSNSKKRQYIQIEQNNKMIQQGNENISKLQFCWENMPMLLKNNQKYNNENPQNKFYKKNQQQKNKQYYIKKVKKLKEDIYYKTQNTSLQDSFSLAHLQIPPIYPWLQHTIIQQQKKTNTIQLQKLL